MNNTALVEQLVGALERLTNYTFNATYCGAVKNTACRCSGNCQVFYELEAANAALTAAKEAPQVGGVEVDLNVIRKWPEGFEARLQHVWLDVVSFIPNVKLWDLQRTLAEFGYTMKVYEPSALLSASPTTPAQPVNQVLLKAAREAATSLDTISRLAGKTHYVGDDGERIETYMGHHDQVRGYAASRANVAWEEIAQATQPGAGLTDAQIRRLMQVALEWADEPNDPDNGRSDKLELALRAIQKGQQS